MSDTRQSVLSNDRAMLTSHSGRRPCLAGGNEPNPLNSVPWQCAQCHFRRIRPRQLAQQSDRRRPGRRKLACQSKGKPKTPLDDAESNTGLA